jgi:hypothetical protein
MDAHVGRQVVEMIYIVSRAMTDSILNRNLEASFISIWGVHTGKP